MKSILVLLSFLAATVLSAALPKRAPSGQNVVYWGQSDGQRSLRSYCASGQGIDIVVLSFISTVGNGQAPSGNFGNECWLNAEGGGNCDTLKSSVDYCKSQGKKVLLSIGGWGAKYNLTSKADAEGVAWSLWNSWAAPSAVNSTAPRPIGTSFVDGWDFDIESNPNNSGQHLGTVVTKLRSYFTLDPNHKYIVTAAPQCPIPEYNMGQAITSSKFDYLFIQFYNNDYCSAYQQFNNNGGAFNYDDWVSYTANTSSANAKLFIGLSASDAIDGNERYFLPPANLSSLVKMYKSHARLGGTMMWDARLSDQSGSNGCSYAQHAKKILDTGNSC